MAVRVAVAPGLLQWAVDRARWDDETRYRRAPKLDAWLAGAKPTLKQLEKFASDTHTPLGMLFLSAPPEEVLPIPDMRTIGNARVERPSADLLDAIYLCQNRQSWYREYALSHGFDEVGVVGSAMIEDSPMRVASEIRSALGFEVPRRAEFSSWENALRGLIDRIESLGVLVMVSGIVGANTHRVLRPDEFRGFALADPVAPLIFVNGADTKAAQIFTIIHELAHIWLGESALSDAAMKAPNGQDNELWCNLVAAEVLVPSAVLKRDYRGNPSDDELRRLASRYRVSTLVVLKQLHNAGLLEWSEFDQRYDEELQRVMAIVADNRANSSGGNYYFTQPLRLSRSFARAVVSSAYDGTTSYRDAYRLLGTKRHETFRSLANELGVA